MTDEKTPDNQGDEGTVDTQVLNETIEAQREMIEKLTADQISMKKQFDGISGQLRIQKKEEPVPSKDKDVSDPTSALESRLNQMQSEMDKRQLALDKKEIFIEAGISSEERELFEGVNDLEAVRRLANQMKTFRDKLEKGNDEPVKQKIVTKDSPLPKKADGKDYTPGESWALWKEAQTRK